MLVELPAFAMLSSEGRGDADAAASLLAAAGAAVALDIPLDITRVGIETFEHDCRGKAPVQSLPRLAVNL